MANARPDRRSLLEERAKLLDEQATRLAERHLHPFIKQAWSIVETERSFVDNWHIGAICEHLEAVEMGQIENLLINQPPSTMKSLTASVFFPAWVWTRRASKRFMCASFDQTLATRDNSRMRDIVESQWYQDRWPVVLRSDQNQKTRFANTAGGWRSATSIGGRAIGDHPNFKIIDDPHDPKKQLLSDKEIESAIQWYDFRMKTRGAMIGAATIILMQRLHEKDLSGHVLETPGKWVHLCLPMRWENRKSTTLPSPTGWRDPREGKPGALLWPTEWTLDKVNSTFKPNTWGDAGQFQQRPAPAGGLMFKRTWFRFITARPPTIVARVRAWDVAGTADGDGARTAGLRMELSDDSRYVIADVKKGRWEDNDVDKQMKLTAKIDGPEVKIREEQEPGSSGKAVINAHRRLLGGYDYRGLPPQSDKITRARPLRSQAEGGNVYILVEQDESGVERVPQWAIDFLDEIELFPAGALKDQVDAASQAFNSLSGVSEPLDITTGEPTSDAELTETQLAEREQLRRDEAERAVTSEIERNGVYWPGGTS